MKTLAQYLNDEKITQVAFADRIGVKQPTVSRWCEGVSDPSPEYAKKIEEATGGEVPFYGWTTYAAFAPEGARQ